MATLWELFVQVTGDSSSFKKSMKDSGDSVLGFEKLVSESFNKIAGYLTAGAIVDGILKVGEAFEKADIKIQRATGASGAALEGMNESLKRLYVGSAQSAETIAGVMAKITQKTGATGSALEILTKSELSFAKVTGSDVTSAVTTNERVFAAWGVTVKQQTQALDVMYVATQKTGISAEQLSQSLVTTGPALRNLGFSFKESVALIASFEKAGLNADEMVMGLNKAFAAFAAAGKDPKQALLDLIDKMGTAATRTDALNLAIDAGFTTKTAGKFVDAVKSGAFNLADLAKALDGSSGAVANMAAKTDTLAEAWTKFTHQVSVTAAPAGQGILTFATKSLQGWALIFSDLKGKLGSIEDEVNKHPLAAFALGLALKPLGVSGGAAGGGAESNLVWNPKTGGFDEQSGPLKAPIGDIGSKDGGAGSAGGGLIPGDKTHWSKDLADSLAVLVAREKEAQSAHAATIGEIAKSGGTIQEYFTAKIYEAVKGETAFTKSADNLPAIGDAFTALAKPIDEVDKFVVKMGKDFNTTNQEALDNSPFGKLAEAAQYFGVETRTQLEQNAKYAEWAFDVMLKSGQASDKALAISGLKMVQSRLEADLAMGRISQEQYDKESARVKQDLASWQGALNTKESALQKWAKRTADIVGSVDKTFQQLGIMGGEAFAKLSQGMGSAIADAIVYGGSIKKAMQSALAATLESLAAQSLSYAIYATALGFLRLAQWDFVGAGNAFASAAIFGTVGIGEALLGSAVAPKDEKKGSAASSAGGLGTVPFDNFPAFLHKNETVLPADIATPLRSQLRSGGPVGGGGIQVHIANMTGVARETVNLLATQIVRQSRLAGARI